MCHEYLIGWFSIGGSDESIMHFQSKFCHDRLKFMVNKCFLTTLVILNTKIFSFFLLNNKKYFSKSKFLNFYFKIVNFKIVKKYIYNRNMIV